ncbi:MAG: hypothetical protein ACAH17_03150 [Candidatus Paceibacterota bacterium]
MSGPLDVVKFAKGDVRVPVNELTITQRMELFQMFHLNISGHFGGNGNRGGSSFIPWEVENFGEGWTTHTLRRENLTFHESLWPKEEKYTVTTRVVSLTCDRFKMPHFKKPKDEGWEKGDKKLVTRLCLTQDGKLHLEWYEGVVVEMRKDYPRIPSVILVDKAEYFRIHPYNTLGDNTADIAIARLKLLLQENPFTLFHFGSAILSLLDHEATEREKRAQRDRALFRELNYKGRGFHITHP